MIIKIKQEKLKLWSKLVYLMGDKKGHNTQEKTHLERVNCWLDCKNHSSPP